jgi:hypothetical protein
MALLTENPERFAALLTGATDTSQPKYEITRRLRLHSIAEATITMQNADISVFRDEKPDIFCPDADIAANLTVLSSAFYTSREIKALGSESVKINGARAVGTLLTETEVFVVYNTGGSLMKWEYKSEMRTKALMKSVICWERLPRQYQMESVRGLMLGNDMEQVYSLLTSTGGMKRKYFTLDGIYDSFVYLPNDHNGEVVLKLLCDKAKISELNCILSENLDEHDSGLLIENDAIDERGDPVLFSYDCDMPRIIRFNSALGLHGRNGTLICFDFQEDALRRFCGERIRFQTIDIQKFEGRFFP